MKKKFGKRLFTLTISKNLKESNLENEDIVKISFKCGKCNISKSYTTNGYNNFFEEIDAMATDYICECVPK